MKQETHFFNKVAKEKHSIEIYTKLTSLNFLKNPKGL